MPYLSPEDRQRLLGPDGKCKECSYIIYKCYCRVDDKFYWDGHDPNCSQHKVTHQTCSRVYDSRKSDFLREPWEQIPKA